jgi:hypothetical protein
MCHYAMHTQRIIKQKTGIKLCPLKSSMSLSFHHSKTGTSLNANSFNNDKLPHHLSAVLPFIKLSCSNYICWSVISIKSLSYYMIQHSLQTHLYKGHSKITGNTAVLECYILASAGNSFLVTDWIMLHASVCFRKCKISVKSRTVVWNITCHMQLL